MKASNPLRLTITFTLALLVRGNAGWAVNSNSMTRDGIEYYIQADKAIYDLSENVEMLYRVTNLGNEAVTIPCLRAPELNLLVQEEAETIWMKVQGWWWYSPGVELSPGESVDLSHIWDMRDDRGNQVDPGIYGVVGVMYNYEQTEVEVPITIIPEPGSLVLFIACLPLISRFNKKRRS